MSRYTPCRVVVAFDDGRDPQRDDDADLHVGEDGALLLSYWDDQGAVVLVGGEGPPGHYACTARSRPRRVTLRREDARTFTGVWEQGGECGTLRIELPGAAASDEEER